MTDKQNNRRHTQLQKGQALVILLFYMIIAITLTTTAIALAISNSVGAMEEEEGNHALEIAESGAENALLRLLRDLSYTGETLPVGNGSAGITVAGSNPKTVTIVGTEGSFSRTVRVTATFTAGVMTINSWQEL
jgi:hypothetical protein